MMIGMGLFWLAVIIGVVWLARDGFDRRQQQQETALAILDQRFAEGAVWLDEYRQRRDVLTDSTVPRQRPDVIPTRAKELTMKRLVLGAAAAGGAAFALHHFARKGRAMHDHCRELMCGLQRLSAGCQRRKPVRCSPHR